MAKMRPRSGEDLLKDLMIGSPSPSCPPSSAALDPRKEGGGEEEESKKSRQRVKHDLLHEGIDWEHVLKYEEKIEELKKKALVPMAYTIHAPIQLIPERSPLPPA